MRNVEVLKEISGVYAIRGLAGGVEEGMVKILELEVKDFRWHEIVIVLNWVSIAVSQFVQLCPQWI